MRLANEEQRQLLIQALSAVHIQGIHARLLAKTQDDLENATLDDPAPVEKKEKTKKV